jgi:hypothetical protein
MPVVTATTHLSTLSPSPIAIVIPHTGCFFRCELVLWRAGV